MVCLHGWRAGGVSQSSDLYLLDPVLWVLCKTCKSVRACDRPSRSTRKFPTYFLLKENVKGALCPAWSLPENQKVKRPGNGTPDRCMGRWSAGQGRQRADFADTRHAVSSLTGGSGFCTGYTSATVIRRAPPHPSHTATTPTTPANFREGLGTRQAETGLPALKIIKISVLCQGVDDTRMEIPRHV